MRTGNIARVIIMVIGLLCGCKNIGEQAEGAYNFTKCRYTFVSVSDMSLAGVAVDGDISQQQAYAIIAILLGNPKNVPLGLTVNIDVENPTGEDAFMNGTHYVIEMDGIIFSEGTLDREIRIPAGEKESLCLPLAAELSGLLAEDSRDITVRALLNLTGLANNTVFAPAQASKVTLRLKPVFKIAGKYVDSPAYIPLSFYFKGGKLSRS